MDIVKKILAFFYTDLQWKLVSLGLAVVVWIIAMHMHNPYENSTFTNPMELQNMGVMDRDQIVVLNEEELLATAININVRGERNEFRALATADNLRFFPFIDLRAVDSAQVLHSDMPVSQTLAVNANLLEGFELQFVRPAQVEVLLDRLERRIFTVEVSYTGQVREGFELRSVEPVIHMVAITGARTHVDMIAHVRVEVDLEDHYGVFEIQDVPLTVYDHNGEDITDLMRSLSVNETIVRVQALPVRALEFRVGQVGALAPGFAVAGIEPNVIFENVVGDAAIFEDIFEDSDGYILLEVDLSGYYEDFEQQVLISDFLPAGLELSKYADPEITVSVVVEPVATQPFSVPRGDISIFGFGGLQTPVDGGTHVRVVVSGPRSVVRAMTTRDVGLEMDFRNLPIGIHRVPLAAILPPGVWLAESLPSLEIQVHAPAGEEPPEDPTPTPEPLPSPAPDPSPEPSPAPSPEPSPPPDENGNGENGTGEYPPEYPPENGNGDGDNGPDNGEDDED